MGSLNKKASGAQCFIMALGLFWDIVTGLPWTPNGVGSLEPRGYCIFLPGAHYLTINSPYGADSSLNKLLLLLLLLLDWYLLPADLEINDLKWRHLVKSTAAFLNICENFKKTLLVYFYFLTLVRTIEKVLYYFLAIFAPFHEICHCK